MKYRSGIFFFIFLLYSLPAIAQFNTIPINQAEFSKLPVYNRQRVHIQKDWLINKITQQAKVYRTKGDHLIISNGLISRAFSLEPNGATIAYINLMTGTSLLRAIRPEAKIDINGIWYDIGGLTGQPIQAYFRPVWLDSMKANPTAWKLTGYKIGKIQARLKWKKMLKWMPQNLPWPPHGITLTFRYRINNKILKNLHVSPVDHLGYLTHVIIDVHYA